MARSCRAIVCVALGVTACWRAAPDPVEPVVHPRPAHATPASGSATTAPARRCYDLTFDPQDQRCKRGCPYDAVDDAHRRRRFRDALVGRGYSCATWDLGSCVPPPGTLTARIVVPRLGPEAVVTIGAGSKHGVAIGRRGVLIDDAGIPFERGDLRLTQIDKNRTMAVARDTCVLQASRGVLFEP